MILQVATAAYNASGITIIVIISMALFAMHISAIPVTLPKPKKIISLQHLKKNATSAGTQKRNVWKI